MINQLQEECNVDSSEGHCFSSAGGRIFCQSVRAFDFHFISSMQNNAMKGT
jgi:hypothetical protein